MLILPQKNSLRKSILLYRRILRHKGHGVHSPFVYNLITKVIEEHCPYYRFSDIELLRRRLLLAEDTVLLSRNGRLRRYSVASIVAHKAIRPKQGALLFRLTNYFRSQNILQIGASVGLSTLYLTSYSQDVKCVTLEKLPAYASIARRVYEKAACRSVDLRVGDYTALLPCILEEMNTVDFVFFNTSHESSIISLFHTCAKYAKADTVFVFEGIKDNRTMRRLWKTVCAHPEVTVTLDLYSMGIVFFNRKLHKRDYTVYF
jgi:predicted O-methyltransferase YrrM